MIHAAHNKSNQPNAAKREEVNSTDASRIKWCRIVNVNITIGIRSLAGVRLRGPQTILASRRAAFSGNTSLIATISSSVGFEGIYGRSISDDLWLWKLAPFIHNTNTEEILSHWYTIFVLQQFQCLKISHLHLYVFYYLHFYFFYSRRQTELNQTLPNGRQLMDFL